MWQVLIWCSFVLFSCAGRSDFPTPPENLLVLCCSRSLPFTAVVECLWAYHFLWLICQMVMGIEPPKTCVRICRGRGIMPSVSCILPQLLLASNFMFQAEACLPNVFILYKKCNYYHWDDICSVVVRLCLQASTVPWLVLAANSELNSKAGRSWCNVKGGISQYTPLSPPWSTSV